jgi:UDP-N-acetylglucosamine:LPS N-acetylglucosamine transferase
MPHIDLIYFNAGGGHRAAAEALREVMSDEGSPWQVRLLNLFELLDPQDLFQRITRMRPEDYYNRRLARGWTFGMAQELKLLQATIRLAHPKLVQRLQQHWSRSSPDLAVSVVPNFNLALAHSLQAERPGTPFVTVLTDLADHPPHFWIERSAGQHLVCGTDRAMQQAREAGVDERHLHRSSGMILRPGFYRAGDEPRVDARRALGLDEHTPTGVVLFGGQGSSEMLGIAERLADVPLILMCGHNRSLAERLRALPAAAPRVIVGYTQDVPQYLRLSDFFIGKPGPGSLSEALHCGLPVIVTRNAWTMPQERFNTDWVLEQGVGLVLPSFAGLPEAVARLRTHWPEYAERVRRLDNRALFEVPQILAGILRDAQCASAGGAQALDRVERATPAANDAGEAVMHAT